MTHQPPVGTSTRRNLLKMLAALGTVALPGTASAQTGKTQTPRAPLRTTVVVPRASQYPELSAQFLRGLREVAGHHAELQVVTTGPTPRAVLAATEQALMTQPEVLVLLGDGLVETARPALHLRPTPVIAATLGGRLPDPQGPVPLSVQISLQSWEAEWAHGAHLVRSGHNSIHLLLSHLDSGYDLPYAFTEGVTSAGGRLSGVTLFDPTHLNLTGLMTSLARSGSSAVHVLSSGTGQNVIRACEQLGMWTTCGGLSSPDMGPRHGSVLASAGTPGESPLYTLGADVGQWLSLCAAQHSSASARTPLALYTVLTQSTVTSARGDLRLQRDGVLRAPLVLRRPGVAPLELAAPDGLRTAALAAGELRSGWLHPYLHA